MSVDLKRSVVLLDKPAGLSSFKTAQMAAQKLHLRKCGHTGTLDENVTGVLVVAFEHATRAISELVGLDKGYEGTMRALQPLDEDALRAACAEFVGRIMQLPPAKCAVKREVRPRTVHSFEILRVRGDEADFVAEVEAGTYIRALLRDVGEKIGNKLGMASLRRTHVGPFRIEECVTVGQLRPVHAFNIVDALRRVGLEVMTLTDEQVREARRGNPVGRADSDEPGPSRVLVDAEGKLVALARNRANGIWPWRVFPA
jgi:tRNA pseudouridine55 synthase